VRALVERTREDVLRYLRIRWINVRQESGFNDLEGWALKEISHGIAFLGKSHLNIDYWDRDRGSCR
jgi:hypothetical protein